MDHLSFYQGKKVAVPGGGGFLGLRIVERLKHAGAEVFIPRTNQGIDFTIEKTCYEYMEKVKPEVVINCAAFQGGIGFHKGKEAELFLYNMKMGLFLMEAAQASGVQKFINIVAGCSYPGYVEKDELNEEDYWSGEVHDSIFSYGVSRKMSVVYGKALKKQFNFNSIHLIYANMYGPGEHFNPDQSKALAGLIKKFYEAKKNNLPSVEVWGTGKPVRDWLYVEDGAEAALCAGELYNEIEPLNIASGIGVSIADLARLIKKIIGYDGEIVFNTSKPDGALKKTLSTRKMKEKLHWFPGTSLEDGIKETIDWFDKNYDSAVKN
ncbi:MAG: NAD-dependent epimerase/dehydratase family protein [Candidatus Liptonbacteria bacterium]|nr:NAD-dependent epimerase/dehydratase family protein [Candidatus Liptonbacteria bacterium]